MKALTITLKMDELEKKIAEALSDPKVMKLVDLRKKEFIEKGKSSTDEIFMELVFCTLTANTSAEMGLRCESAIRELGLFDANSLKGELVKCGYRFPNTRSRFIEFNYNRRYLLKDILESDTRRDSLIGTYMGIGMKEASHFLRNTGHFEYSILDKHIQRFLSAYYGVEVNVKNRKGYEEGEKLFSNLSSLYGMEPGLMDLVVWYIMTGKILK
ncbi:MAG: N-glycosylase [Thermoplasmatales archaeon]